MKLDKSVQKSSSRKDKSGIVEIGKFYQLFSFVWMETIKIISFARSFRFCLEN